MRTIYWFRMSSLRLRPRRSSPRRRARPALPGLLPRAAHRDAVRQEPPPLPAREPARPRRRLRSLNSRLIVLDGAPEVALRAALAGRSTASPTSRPRQRRVGGRRRRSTRSPRRRACRCSRAAGTRCATSTRCCCVPADRRPRATRPSSAPLRARCAGADRRAPGAVAPAAVGGEATAADDAARRPAPADVGLPADADAAVLVRGGESRVAASTSTCSGAAARGRRRWSSRRRRRWRSSPSARGRGRRRCSRRRLRPPPPRLFYTRLAAEAYGRHPARDAARLAPASCCGASSSTRAPTARRTTSGWSATRSAARCRGRRELLAAWAEGRRGTRGSTRR